MAKEVMVRHASDNEYLHRDFHLFMNRGIEYLRKNYGEEHVIAYLRQFSKSYYSILKKNIIETGLEAIKAHFVSIYDIEKASDALNIDCKDGEMTITISYCPAVKYLRESGMEPSPMYVETTRTVWDEVCSDTKCSFELVSYDDETGAAKMIFKEA